MVRLKDDEKRKAILEAAIKVFAERGISSTPTAAISKAAQIAEGTLFTYFNTKDVLINELYISMKAEMAEAILTDLPETDDFRATLEHIWKGYVAWGAANPNKNKVISQLKVSEKLSCESLDRANGPFAIIEKRVNEAIANKEVRAHSCEFMAAMMTGMADVTMAFMNRAQQTKELHPEELDPEELEIDYCKQGFEVLWNGIAMSTAVSKKNK
jgi:AcrR family transcriptional regulator